MVLRVYTLAHLTHFYQFLFCEKTSFLLFMFFWKIGKNEKNIFYVETKPWKIFGMAMYYVPNQTNQYLKYNTCLSFPPSAGCFDD